MQAIARLHHVVLGEEDSQATWSILKCSLAQKLDWHLSLCYPSDIMEAALELDTILWDLLEHATKLHIPKLDEGLDVECVPQVPGITSLQGRSFQRFLVHQPVKQGGFVISKLPTLKISFHNHFQNRLSGQQYLDNHSVQT